ncbi:hypothetical protein Tco_0075994, partial [Tanacetum coccineum]
MQKESVSKQGRKSTKAEPSVHKDPLFNELADDTLDYIETEDAQDVGRTRDVVNEEKETTDDEVSTADDEAEPSVHKDPLFNELADDTLDYMETEDAQDVGRTRDVVNEEKETADDEVSIKDAIKLLNKKLIMTRKIPDEGTVDQTEGRSVTPTTPTTTPIMFGDDETIAQVLREKEKGVKLKDVEETERLRPTSTRSLLTLKPLPKI